MKIVDPFDELGHQEKCDSARLTDPDHAEELEHDVPAENAHVDLGLAQSGIGSCSAALRR